MTTDKKARLQKPLTGDQMLKLANNLSTKNLKFLESVQQEDEVMVALPKAKLSLGDIYLNHTFDDFDDMVEFLDNPQNDALLLEIARVSIKVLGIKAASKALAKYKTKVRADAEKIFQNREAYKTAAGYAALIQEADKSGDAFDAACQNLITATPGDQMACYVQLKYIEYCLEINIDEDPKHILQKILAAYPNIAALTKTQKDDADTVFVTMTNRFKL